MSIFKRHLKAIGHRKILSKADDTLNRMRHPETAVTLE